MEVEKLAGVRGNTDLRFRFHVVEGAGLPGTAIGVTQNPGRIRTLYVDTNCEGAPWLRLEWDEHDKVKTKLLAANISHEQKKRGAFFLLDAFDEDPDPKIREQGKALYAEHDLRRRQGQTVGEFPEEWLPKRVRDLRALKKSTAVHWAPPPYAATEASADDDAPLGEVVAETTRAMTPLVSEPAKKAGK